jgi:hypothetical protein
MLLFVTIVDSRLVKRIVRGQNTAQFGRASEAFKEMKERSFSIFYATSEGEDMTLDLVVETPAQFEYLFDAIEVSRIATKRCTEAVL